MSCNELNDDRVAAYVAGVLADDDLATFESHLLVCEHCRAAVRQAELIKRAFVTSGRSTKRPSYPWIGGIVAAASIALIAIPRSDSLRDLGAVSPPVFHGALVRSSADSTRTLIDRGMAAYSARDFATAARNLAAAHDSSAAVAFYLGASLLMRNQPARALTALERAKQPAGNPFAADAHYLAAKSWLRLGNADSALAEIDRVSVDDEAANRRLAALRDSVRRILR